MLSNINLKPNTVTNAPSCAPGLDSYNQAFDRDECEDFQTAIQYLYEFKKKLSALHPGVMYLMDCFLASKRSY